jgi:hypothetical protein
MTGGGSELSAAGITLPRHPPQCKEPVSRCRPSPKTTTSGIGTPIAGPSRAARSANALPSPRAVHSVAHAAPRLISDAGSPASMSCPATLPSWMTTSRRGTQRTRQPPSGVGTPPDGSQRRLHSLRIGPQDPSNSRSGAPGTSSQPAGLTQVDSVTPTRERRRAPLSATSRLPRGAAHGPLATPHRTLRRSPDCPTLC